KVYIDSGATLIRVKSYQLVLSLIRSKVKRTVHRRCLSVLFIDTLHRYCLSVLFMGKLFFYCSLIDLMDENTVRGWLKDHKNDLETLVHQQTMASQSQYEALRSELRKTLRSELQETLRYELQAACGLLQTRHGGGGDQGALLPRSIRLDVPKFSGINPKSWIFAINEYFLLLNTPAEQRLRIVGFNLEGAAAEWFRWMSRNGLITTWDRFEESVKNHFGPSKYEDPQGALSKLLHLGMVEEY
ncbi:hypothetical protein Tco_1323667, partial [Tanacetum coccineum]